MVIKQKVGKEEGRVSQEYLLYLEETWRLEFSSRIINFVIKFPVLIKFII